MSGRTVARAAQAFTVAVSPGTSFDGLLYCLLSS